MSSPESATVRAHVNWSDHEKRVAVEVYGETGNVREVARRLGIPRETIREWLGKAENRELVDEACRKGVQLRIERGTRASLDALNEISRRLEEPATIPHRDLTAYYSALQSNLEVDLKRQQQQNTQPDDPARFFEDLELLSRLQAELAKRRKLKEIEAQVVEQTGDPNEPAE
jgi:hypothetical protein